MLVVFEQSKGEKAKPHRKDNPCGSKGQGFLTLRNVLDAAERTGRRGTYWTPRNVLDAAECIGRCGMY
ncbi:MAG TPA: hypothetical protein VJR02_01530, partial [Pyrinomonadaceae bacterium]|nr:hypothetical protein [Pyrinomonadaceae bacterium]